MSSSYYSLVPRSQKPYATPWYQRTYVDNPISIEEELENAITQLISENDISSVPSADAIYKYLHQRLKNIVISNVSNTFTETNNFAVPIISETNIDFNSTDSLKYLPNVGSIKQYVTDLISGEIPDLTQYINSLINSAISNSYTYVSQTALANHIIPHNMNTSYVIYNVLIFDPTTGSYKNDLVSVSELDSNTLVVELESPQIIKVIVNRIISGRENTFTYTSSTASTTHMLSHNLNSEFVYYSIMVYDEITQLYRNDLVSITEVNNDSMLVETSQPVNIKAAIAIF